MIELIEPVVEEISAIFLNFIYSKIKDKKRTLAIVGRKRAKLQRIKIIPREISANDKNRAITKTMYPWDHPTTENLEKRLGNKTVHFIYEYHLDDIFIGYSIIYPINQKCVDKYLNKTYRSGSDIENKDIANNFEDCAGYYIAYLIAFDKKWGTGERRTLVAMKCQQQLANAMQKCRKSNVHVFTKPTKNTIKAVENHQLSKISLEKDNYDSIFKIDRNQLLQKGFGFTA
ncbi:MAG: hypothetical protein RIM99_14535 [Cyclobacteriaceae bacterium]